MSRLARKVNGEVDEQKAFDVNWTEWHYAKIRAGSAQEIRDRFWELVGEQTGEAYGIHEITRIREVTDV